MTARNKIDFVILIWKRITLCGINRAIFPDDMKKKTSHISRWWAMSGWHSLGEENQWWKISCLILTSLEKVPYWITKELLHCRYSSLHHIRVGIGIRDQMKLPGQCHGLLSQVNSSLGNMPRLPPMRVRHGNNKNWKKKMTKYLFFFFFSAKKMIILPCFLDFVFRQFHYVTSIYSVCLVYNEEIILARQNTITLIASWCYEMKDSVLPS